MPAPLVLGLTGGYCAGKNLVAGLLERRGWSCIDVDTLGHRALELAAGEVASRFGAGILSPDGKIDRRKLGAIVFADEAALRDHEAIIHPVMSALLDEALALAASPPGDAHSREGAGAPAGAHSHETTGAPGGAGSPGGGARVGGAAPGTCINAAILYRLPQLALCDAVIEVRAPLALRIRRGASRDGLPPDQVRARIARQAPLWRRRPRLTPPVYFLRNDGDRDAADAALDSILAGIDRRP